jgi:2-polyprenyl-6-methoxyphenol hydroxylase-like FAD-dependent oxidoreductase
MCTAVGGLAALATDAERLAQLKHITSTVAEPWKSVFEVLPEDTRVYEDTLTSWETIPWDSHGGRVVLAGDAAHAMPPRTYSQLLKPPVFTSPLS